MGIEENKKIAIEMFEAIQIDDIPAIDELMTSDCIFHLLGNNPPTDLNREQVKEMFSSPNYTTETATVEDVIAEGDRVSLRFTISVKHPGKSTAVAWFSTYRIQDGKIAECWTLNNDLDLYQQLGALPPTEEIRK